MAYAPPSIGPAGLTINSYADILADLQTKFQGIFGSSVYLANDSADEQWLAVLALKIFDENQALQLVYNNRGPATAVGSALDGIVKLNGIARKPASFSTCVVTLSGAPGTVITNGVVKDVNGFLWNLAPSVTLTGGSTSASVTCQKIGAITALPGDLTLINTPVKGWTAVTNPDAATVGQPVENDSQLRARQAISAALPSISMLTGTIAAIASLQGVGRYVVYENPTGSTGTDPNGYGLPPHSITAVVEGSTVTDIAQAIYNNKSIGCFTNGTTTIVVTDPVNGGLTEPISFYLPSPVPVYVAMTVKKLAGYTVSTTDAITAAIAKYLNGLQIGEIVTVSGIVGAALSVMASLEQPTFSVTLSTVAIDTTPSPTNTSDLTLQFYEVASGAIGNVVVTAI